MFQLFLYDFKIKYLKLELINKKDLFLFLKIFFNRINDRRKFLLKKYVYTINHKRIAINYFFFSMWTGLSGAALATMIRLELAHPGSPFFKGDSLRYLQVITAHGLIMVFFVVVPLIFGGFANFLIPYHIGSKDVAYPRLNSIGFWIQPCGFILVAKIAFLRPQFWRYYDKTSIYFPLIEKSNLFKKINLFDYSNKNYESFLNWKVKSKSNFSFFNSSNSFSNPIKFFLLRI